VWGLRRARSSVSEARFRALLYETGFTDLAWLPAVTEVSASFVARRNADLPLETLRAFASTRVPSGAWVSLANAVPAEEPHPAAESAVCGQPEDRLFGDIIGLAGCTRFRGSIHLPDVADGSLEELSSLIQIDGSLSLFRNHTSDFTSHSETSGASAPSFRFISWRALPRASTPSKKWASST
jgi:hypothetical protein